MTDMSVILPFPKQHRQLRKVDRQGDHHAPHPINLSERLRRVSDGMDAGMTRADIQNEYDAQQAERVIQHWVRKLADNPRRGPSDAAAFLGAEAGRLYGEEAS